MADVSALVFDPHGTLVYWQLAGLTAGLDDISPGHGPGGHTYVKSVAFLYVAGRKIFKGSVVSTSVTGVPLGESRPQWRSGTCSRRPSRPHWSSPQVCSALVAPGDAMSSRRCTDFDLTSEPLIPNPISRPESPQRRGGRLQPASSDVRLVIGCQLDVLPGAIEQHSRLWCSTRSRQDVPQDQRDHDRQDDPEPPCDPSLRRRCLPWYRLQ